MSYLILGILPIFFLCILYSVQLFGKSIVKSPNDKKKYRALRLKNGLQVLLISDPKTCSSAASMNVNVGQFQDSEDAQGLAHYLEHMLFLGTKKYPTAGEFSDYLSSHGGTSNAYTSFENTNYYFSVHKDFLPQALDRFSQFFISPTFNQEFSNREVNAVHSEYKKNIKDDGRRVYQVIKHLSNAQHPFCRFGTGNLESLLNGDKSASRLANKLKGFYQKYYLAGAMQLVVLGKESLEQLEKLVKMQFSGIKKGENDRRAYQDIPIINAKLPRIIKIETIKSLRELKLMFPLPSQQEHYRSKPTEFIAYLLGDEGKGSILSVLKEKGWATSLGAGSSVQTSSFSFFSLSISLTEDGIHQVDAIIQLVFAYIDLIKKEKNTSLKRYYEEIKKVSSIGFQYQEKSPPISLVNRLAEDMGYIPAVDVVAAKWIHDGYSEKLNQSILSRLVPENLQVLVITNKLKEADQKEKWYGTSYLVQDTLSSQVKGWRTDKGNWEVALPKPNPFIPEKIEIKKIDHEDPHPILLENKKGLKIWFKHDAVFKVPKANLRIILSNQNAYKTPKNAALSTLFTLLLLENLNEYSYPATVAGLRFTVTNIVRGLYISISGYPDNIEVILNRIIDEIIAFKIDPRRFKTFKNQLIERKQNQRHFQAYRRSMYEFYHLISQTLWHFESYLEAIKSLTVEDLKEFLPDLIERMNIEILGHGNLLDKDLRRYSKRLQVAFNSNCQGATVIEERTLKLPSQSDLVYQLITNDINSSIYLYFQVGDKNTEQSVALDVLHVLIEKPFYHQLRTLEQRGYIVWSGYQELNNVEGFYYVIQSGEKDPEYLQSRIEHFIKLFGQTVDELSNEEFEHIVKTLIDKRLEPPKNLLEETKIYWKEITSQNYNFTSLEDEIEALRKMKKEDVIAFYKKIFLDKESCQRLAIHAFSKNHELKQTGHTKIENLKAFKKHSKYFENHSKMSLK